MKSSHRRRPRRILTPDEYKRQRRERRMTRTGRLEEEVRAFAERHGCSLRVLNDGHHWLFQRPGFMAEWWPSSANLAVNRDYLRSHHAPHWPDVAKVLQSALAAQTAVQTEFPLAAAARPVQAVGSLSATRQGGNR